MKGRHVNMGPGNTDRYAVGYTALSAQDGPPRRLAPSGPPMRDMRLERNRDHPSDSDLCFERGQYLDRVRLTVGDLHALRALLTARGDLENLRAGAVHLARQGVPEEHGKGNANLAVRLVKLVNEAHAAGYRLAGDDIRATAEDVWFIRDYLLSLKEDGTDRGHLDIEALERVIAMLGEK